MTTAHAGRGLVHSALFYRSENEFLDLATTFVAEGLGKHQAVLVALPGDKVASLRGELGGAVADRVGDLEMSDVTEVGRNPGRILAVLSAFVEKNRHRPVRLIGEAVWKGGTADEYPACVEHEALVNIAFEGRDVTGVCLYDASGLDASVLADARATHPLIWQEGTHQQSADYSVSTALE